MRKKILILFVIIIINLSGCVETVSIDNEYYYIKVSRDNIAQLVNEAGTFTKKKTDEVYKYPVNNNVFITEEFRAITTDKKICKVSYQVKWQIIDPVKCYYYGPSIEELQRKISRAAKIVSFDIMKTINEQLLFDDFDAESIKFENQIYSVLDSFKVNEEIYFDKMGIRLANLEVESFKTLN